MSADELVLDEGVLCGEPLCELQSFGAVAVHGGTAVLPWRGEWLRARAAGVAACAAADELETGAFTQCLVHLQKSRAATWCDLAEAWRLLAPHGRLLVCGGNELGVASAVKKLAGELEQRPRVLSNRRHARIVLFVRDDGAGPVPAEARMLALPIPGLDAPPLRAEPGVFSGKRLDAGSELLLAELADRPAPRRVLDLGCGIGPLALAALLRWPEAQALLLDADARAIRSCVHNSKALGVADRCSAVWWDAEEPCPASDFDLVLMNPPFHTGKAVDLGPARAMFQRLGEALAPRGHALLVANHTLPWEQDLERQGSLRVLRSERGYKLLELKRRSRSASSSTRKQPGARSSGNS